MVATIFKYLVLVATFGCAFVTVGYEDEAIKKGWPVGSLLQGNAPWLKIVAVIALLVALGISFYVFSWWTPIVIAIAGFFFGLLATQIMAARVQVLAIAGTVIGLALCLLYVI